MTQTPSPRPGRSRRIIVGAVWVAWIVGVLATAVGFLAPFVPALDLVNQIRPFAALAAVVLFAAAIGIREWRLIRPTAALMLFLVGLVLVPWARGSDTAPNAAPALRLLTFNLTADNDRFDDVADFILSSAADIVLLQEVSCTAADRLIPKLKASYPHAFVSASTCFGQVLLSKRPWLTGGQVITGTRKPLLVSAHFQWNDVRFDLTGVNLSDVRAPSDQAADVAHLLAHVGEQSRLQIVAGTFHLTPFAWKFTQLNNAGLGQHATFLATWPAGQPLFLTDNVLSTQGIASVRITTGPALGSGHRPLIADIAFVR